MEGRRGFDIHQMKRIAKWSQEFTTESIAEALFWEEWCEADEVHGQWRDSLIAQYPVLNNQYRVDFAHLDTRTAIEIDDAGHRTRKQYEQDRKRDRQLLMEGWTIVRFTNEEVHKSPRRCANEADRIIGRLDAKYRRELSDAMTAIKKGAIAVMEGIVDIDRRIQRGGA